MPAYAAPQAYRESAVLTASSQELVVMLYDGACRFLRQGAVAMRSGDIATANARMQRAEAIIDHLLATLDHEQGGEVADRLSALYLFFRRHLNTARIQRQPEEVERVASMLGELRSAWAQVSRA